MLVAPSLNRRSKRQRTNHVQKDTPTCSLLVVMRCGSYSIAPKTSAWAQICGIVSRLSAMLAVSCSTTRGS